MWNWRALSARPACTSAVTMSPTALYTTVAAGPVMPPMICLMLATGTATGALTGAASLVARAHDGSLTLPAVVQGFAVDLRLDAPPDV